MTFYVQENITTNQIAGAVAENVLMDLHTNNLTFHGIPKISVSDFTGVGFIVTLITGKLDEFLVEIKLSKDEGIEAARRFQKKQAYSSKFFESIQIAIEELEKLVYVSNVSLQRIHMDT
jgi:hypothetical protein